MLDFPEAAFDPERGPPATSPTTSNQIASRSRVVLVGISAILAVCFVAWIVRVARLTGLADPGDPFDVAGFINVDIPDEENAFAYYRLALSKFSRERPGPVRYLEWYQAGFADRAWLQENRESLAIWRLGARRDLAHPRPPRESSAEIDTSLVRGVRGLVRLALLDALRAEASGDHQEAWSLYHEALRAVGHCGKHGTIPERLIGIAAFREVDERIKVWSEHPNVSSDLLRRALADVLAANVLVPDVSDGFKREYLILRRQLVDVVALERLVSERSDASRFPGGDAIARFLDAEPERSLRVLKHLFANRLARAEASSPSVRTLSDQDLKPWLDSTRYLRLLLLPENEFLDACRTDKSSRAELVVFLATRLFVQARGVSPDTPDELVGTYLKALPDGYETPVRPNLKDPKDGSRF